MKTSIRSLLRVVGGCVLLSPPLQAAITYNVGSTTVAPGDSFSVAITVSPTATGTYTYWANAGFNLSWDPTVLTLQPTPVNISGSPLPLSTASPLLGGNFSSPNAGELRFSWADLSRAAQVPDGSTIFTVNFTATEEANRSTALSFVPGSLANVWLVDSSRTKVTFETPSLIVGQINVVPEPVNCALAVLGCVFLGGGMVRFVSRKRAAH
jgi:hypothetical protein